MRRALLAAGLLVASLPGGPLLAAAAPAAQEACDVTVRIMPLGDSITKGSSSGVAEENKMISYRKTLWESLVGAGYNVDFVGSLTNGQFYKDTEGFDPDHEGHAGYTDAQVATYIYNNDSQGQVNWLAGNSADIILLHIGTNGLNSDPGDVEDILNEIDEYEADSGMTVIVILARIINRVPTTDLTTTFNNNVQNMAQQRINNGDQIVLVNMETGAGIIYSFWNDPVNPGDMWNTGTNGLHPYFTGYDKMARVWRHGIDILFQDCNQWPEIITNPGAPTHSEGQNINLDINATDPEGQGEGTGLTYSATNLPQGLNIDSTTGIISGTIGFDAYYGEPYEVTVTVTDSGLPKMSDSVMFTWTIINTNRPPELTQPSIQISAENSSPSLQLNASDPDGDTLIYGADGLPEGLSVDQDDGLISGTVSYAAASNSPYNVTVTATDNGSPAKQALKTFTWEITNVNRSPQITWPGDQSDFEGGQVLLPVTASDPDGDSLEYSATGLPAGLSIDQDSGVIAGVIGCQAVGSYDVNVAATDPGGLSDSEIFPWNVTAANCSPEVVKPTDQDTSEGDIISLQVAASDPDGPETLTFNAQGLPPGLGISASGLIYGTLDYQASAGSPYTVTITTTDPGGLNDMESFQWQVANTNRPPVLDPVADQTNDEEETVSLDVQASDPDQDALLFSLQGQPAGLSINAGSGLISGMIACGAEGMYEVTVTASDGDLTDNETFAWQVLPAQCTVQQVFIPVLLNRQ